MESYPAQPWHMVGQAYISAWRLPAAALPTLPAGVRPIVVGGNGFVVTAWVDYQEGGALSYRELMATVPVRAGLAASITHIWVDSPVSLAGGRELWNIPKDLAEFDLAHRPRFTASARSAAGPIAEADYQVRGRLPFRLPTSFSVIQEGRKRSPVKVTGRLASARSSWKIDPNGPLGYLDGRRPFASFALLDFRMRFGREPQS